MKPENIIIITIIGILAILLIGMGIYCVMKLGKKSRKKDEKGLLDRTIIKNGSRYPIPYYLSVLYPMVPAKFWINMTDQQLITFYLSFGWYYLPAVYPLPDEWYDYKQQIGTWKDGLNITPQSKYLYFPSLGFDLGDYGIALSGDLRGKSVFGCSVFGNKSDWHSEWNPGDGGLPYNNISFIRPWGYQRLGVPNYAYIETQTYVCEELGRAFLSAPTCNNIPYMIESLIDNYCNDNKCFKAVPEIKACNPSMYKCPDGVKQLSGNVPYEKFRHDDYKRNDPVLCKSPPNIDCITKTTNWDNPDPSCKNPDGTIWKPSDCPPNSLAYPDDTIRTCLNFETQQEGTIDRKSFCSATSGSSGISFCSYYASPTFISGNTCSAPQALWNCDVSNGCVFAIWNDRYKNWAPWPKYLAEQKLDMSYYELEKVFQNLIFGSKPIKDTECDDWWTKCGYVSKPDATFQSNCGKIAPNTSCPPDQKPADGIISPNGSLAKPGKFMAYWMKGYGKFCNMGKTAVYYSFVHMLLTIPKTFPSNGPGGEKVAGAFARWDPIQILASQGNRQYISQLIALCSGEYYDPRKYIQGYVTMFRKGMNRGHLEELDGDEPLPNKLPFETENVKNMLNPLDDPFLQEVDRLTVGKYYKNKIPNPNYGKKVQLPPYLAVILFFGMNLNGDTGGDCPGDLLDPNNPSYCTKGSVAIGKQPRASKSEPFINGNGYYPFGLYFPGSNIGSSCYAIAYNLGWDSIQLSQMPTGAGRGAYCTTSMEDFELVFLRSVQDTCKKYYFTVDVSKDWDNYSKFGFVQGNKEGKDYDDNIKKDKDGKLILNVTPRIMPLTERNMPGNSSPNTWFYPEASPPVNTRFTCPYKDQLVSQDKKHGNY